MENTTYKLYVGVNELKDLLSVGRNTALKIGIDSGASVKIGKRRLYNVETIKRYMASLQNEKIG